jgi:antitoxin CcdA
MRMATARKVATNLSVRADLIREARTIGLNLSEVFEHAVTEALCKKQREQWLADNAEGIKAYNAKVARGGTFSDSWRKF